MAERQRSLEWPIGNDRSAAKHRPFVGGHVDYAMPDKRLRERIAFEAARLLFDRQESDYLPAKRKAARSLGARFRPRDLPSTREIRDQLERIADVVSSDNVIADRRSMLLLSLRILRRLTLYQPELIVDLADGPIDADSSVRIDIFANDPQKVLVLLAEDGIAGELQPVRSGGAADHATYSPIELATEIPAKLRVFPASAFSDRPMNVPRLTVNDVENALRVDDPESDIDAEIEGLERQSDRFEMYQYMLEALEEVRQSPTYHPEGDALYHSLQVFELAVLERPYDEEFLTAALLHDVGKIQGIKDHVASSLSMLDGLVTHRTAWLIAEMPTAQGLLRKELPASDRKRLEASDDFEDVMLLGKLDQAGRKPGAETRTAAEAVDYLRDLESGAMW